MYVTIQPGLCIHCTDRMKTQSQLLLHGGISGLLLQVSGVRVRIWEVSVTVQLAELL